MATEHARGDAVDPSAAAVDAPLGPSATLEIGSAQIHGATQVSAPVTKMKKRQLIPMFVAYFTLYLAWIAPVGFSLAVRMGQLDEASKNTTLALALSVPGIIVLFIAPLIGVLSDRTRSRFGRRRPWMVAGTLIGAVGALIIGLTATIPLVILGWTISFIGYTIVGSMIVTYLGDKLPEEQRGKVMGINGSLSQVAPVVGTAVAGAASASAAAMFLIPGALALVGGLVFIAVMKDEQLTTKPPALNVGGLLRGYWFNPRRHPNLGWVVLSRAMVFLALSFLSLYTVYLLIERLGYTAAQVAGLTASLGLGGVVMAIIGAIGSGWLSDKLGSRKPFLFVSALLLAVSLVLIATMNSVPQYAIATLLSSFAIGVYGAVDQATGLDVMPQEGENGRYLAIFSLGNQVPQSFGPLLAALILSVVGGNYAWVYVAAGVFAVLGALAILPLRIPRRSRAAAPAPATAV
ncbi:MFS transporter [Curtobacterium sp. BRB10]|uniref:MFS transporter n=1 Tax=Curtobacterium sp. BRB10 TaxID=2962579 RepID=UPI00288133E1|nr:MFS transporter [Curtobacterium sp. BRB10]MDT0234843.1 MFS transporter [Curtobacterium sp. BRB10]